MPNQSQSSRWEEVQNLTASVRSIPATVWEDISLGNCVREVAELLHGALWHLSYALELGELDSTPVRDRSKHPSLWKEWLDTGMERLKPQFLVQSMLVSDACLRLAGGLERFCKKRAICQLANRYLKDCANEKERSMIRVIIHRDSFMHPEIPPKSEQLRYKAREKEMCSDTCNVKQLFDDCLAVGFVLAENVTKKLLSQSSK